MQKQEIKISVLNIDGDEVQFQIGLTNGINSTSLDYYGYVDTFKEFADGLISFPKTIQDNLIFQVGEDGGEINWAYFLKLKIFCYEANGHSAIHIIVDNRQDEPYHHRSEFFITTLPATLNELGQRLLAWNPKTEKEFEWTTNTGQ